MYYQSLRISIVAVVAVLLLPFFLFAEVRTYPDADGDGYGDATAYEEVRTTTTESEQEANVCDGVKCPDGSCVATREECLAAEEEATTRPADEEADETGAGTASGSDTEDTAGTEAVPIRADAEPVSIPDYLDPDDDGDGIPTTVENERATPYSAQEPGMEQSQRPDTAGAGATGEERPEDAEEDSSEAQDYNSSRSNKRAGLFEGVDLDSVPETTRTRAGFMKFDDVDGESTEAATTDDGSVWCWGRAETADGTEYRWGRGLCIALAATEEADDAAQDRITALLVQGEEVRGWSEEEREAWRTYRAERAEGEDDEERLIEHMIERVQENERIQEMRADDAGVEMRYQTTLRLFGVIPLQRTITARMDADDTEPVLELPWYSFLTTKPEKETIREIVRDTMDILVLVPGRS